MIKESSHKNIRGAWLTWHQIHQLRNDVTREIANERHPQQKQPNNAHVAIEDEHVDLPNNIILPGENSIKEANLT